LHLIDLDAVVVGDRHRKINEDHIDELVESIKEQGLLQPIVLRRKDNRIIAGGHRYTAFTILATNADATEEERAEYKKIPFVYFDEYLIETGRIQADEHISDGQLMLLEIEENIKRLDMTWQEKCIGIYKYHKEQVKASRKVKITWMQETTGAMLGLSQASVSQNMKIGKELLQNEKSPLWKCESLADAIRFKLAQFIDEGSRIRAARIRARNQAKLEAQPTVETVTSEEKAEAIEHVDTPVPGKAFSMDLIESLFYAGDFREQLPLIAEQTKIDHIICDPPYGINMKNLDTFDGIDRVEETHKVPENVVLLRDFLEVAYDVISESGFLCMWYDLDQHNLLQTHAAKVGWKVCRWPLVWCKTSPCRNSVAQYNFTKSTEVCMILRRSENAVLVEKQSNNYILAPTISSKTHPFVKPFQVWQRLIQAVSMKNQTIVDPFAGEGSCLTAAIQMERFAYGCEIDQKHIDQAIGRMDSELNKASNALAELEEESPF
jgi:DNA modification methylase/ParB-like chromosome segregation protein Spo0J